MSFSSSPSIENRLSSEMLPLLKLRPLGRTLGLGTRVNPDYLRSLRFCKSCAMSWYFFVITTIGSSFFFSTRFLADFDLEGVLAPVGCSCTGVATIFELFPVCLAPVWMADCFFYLGFDFDVRLVSVFTYFSLY